MKHPCAPLHFPKRLSWQLTFDLKCCPVFESTARKAAIMIKQVVFFLTDLKLHFGSCYTDCKQLEENDRAYDTSCCRRFSQGQNSDIQ